MNIEVVMSLFCGNFQKKDFSCLAQAIYYSSCSCCRIRLGDRHLKENCATHMWGGDRHLTFYCDRHSREDRHLHVNYDRPFFGGGDRHLSVNCDRMNWEGRRHEQTNKVTYGGSHSSS